MNAAPFNFSASAYIADKKNIPAIMPGKIHDRADNDGHSGLPEGAPGVYGRVTVAGYSSNATLSGTHQIGDRFYTRNDTVSLPDVNGDYLKTPGGVLYKDAGWSLPKDADGNLIFAGIGMWSDHCKPHPCGGRLKQPFGLNDMWWQYETRGQLGMATQGNIWCYTETDIERHDDLYFRTIVTSTTDGIQLLGAFRNDNDGGNAVPFLHGRSFIPGPAGGLFVLTLNIRNFK